MTGGLERTGRGPYYAQGGIGSVASPHLELAPQRDLDRTEKLNLLPSFHAEEITDPDDYRLLDVFAILSDPDNASHLVEQTRNVEDIQERIKEPDRHVLAVMNDEGEIVATSTIDDSHLIEDACRTIEITSHSLSLFAVRTDLQSDRRPEDRTKSGRRTGSRAFEAVLRWAFEDSTTYYESQRESLYWRINLDVPGAGRMEKIARKNCAEENFIRPRILKIRDKATGKIIMYRGMEFYLSLFVWMDNRYDETTETLTLDNARVPEGVAEYYAAHVHDYNRAVRQKGARPL